uniref:Odorant-binding protein n=1 Tax=Phenacoccus solenopsis TaxID=483260 RepID=A0A0U2X199_9HEMI|nr:odorant-binding protein [Phenacoccus solenopsis]
MYTNIIIFVIAISYGPLCQSQDFLEKEAQVAGSEYMQGIVRYCTALHDTNTEDIVKTYNYEVSDNKAKCAVMCILQSVQIMDQNGQFREDELQSFLEKVPEPEKREEIVTTLNDCVDTGGNNPCEKAFVFTKCLNKLRDMLPQSMVPAL